MLKWRSCLQCAALVIALLLPAVVQGGEPNRPATPPPRKWYVVKLKALHLDQERADKKSGADSTDPYIIVECTGQKRFRSATRDDVFDATYPDGATFFVKWAASDPIVIRCYDEDYGGDDKIVSFWVKDPVPDRPEETAERAGFPLHGRIYHFDVMGIQGTKHQTQLENPLGSIEKRAVGSSHWVEFKAKSCEEEFRGLPPAEMPDAVKEALQENRPLPDLHFIIGKHLYEKGLVIEAMERLAESVRLDPSNLAAIRQGRDVANELGRTKSALKYARMAEQQGGTEEDKNILAQLEGE